MRYLITGGAGFIGSHLAEVLIDRGDEVVALDNLTTGAEINVAPLADHPNFRLVAGSVMDNLLTDELVEDCDSVVHLAAAVGVKLIVEHPARSLRTIIGGTENVLEAAHRYRKPVFVASTSEVYGKNSGKMHEMADRVLGPTSIGRWAYSIGKSVDEVLAFAYWREQELPTIVARFFNTVGPRQTGAYGMVIPRFVTQALRNEDITIYGDGKQSRCFGNVEDVVNGVIALADEPRAVGNVFNLGATEEITIEQLARRIIQLTKSKSKVKFVPYDQAYESGFEDMRRRVPDISKAADLVGFRPRITLHETIRRVAKHIRVELRREKRQAKH